MSEESQLSAWDIVERMMTNDAFSQWMGIEIITVEPGFVKLTAEIRAEHTNGFKIAHGGIAFSLADSALAFASNSRGKVAVSVSSHISYLNQAQEGDKLEVITEELHSGNKTASYRVNVRNQDTDLIASFEGTVYKTSKIWE